jgi:hypothetical protein
MSTTKSAKSANAAKYFGWRSSCLVAKGSLVSSFQLHRLGRAAWRIEHWSLPVERYFSVDDSSFAASQALPEVVDPRMFGKRWFRFESLGKPDVVIGCID